MKLTREGLAERRAGDKFQITLDDGTQVDCLRPSGKDQSKIYAMMKEKEADGIVDQAALWTQFCVANEDGSRMFKDDEHAIVLTSFSGSEIAELQNKITNELFKSNGVEEKVKNSESPNTDSSSTTSVSSSDTNTQPTS